MSAWLLGNSETCSRARDVVSSNIGVREKWTLIVGLQQIDLNLPVFKPYNFYIQMKLKETIYFSIITMETRFNELPSDQGNAFVMEPRLTNCQGTEKIQYVHYIEGSFNRGSFPYYNFSKAEKFTSLYRGFVQSRFFPLLYIT